MDKKLLFLPGKTIEEQFSLFAEEILNESLVNYKKEKLKKEIDKALEQRNKELFYRLSEELKSM